MYLAVGLGNPGIEYRKTFHNCGFDAAERTADLLGVEFSKKLCKAEVAETRFNSEKVIVARPLTYMNLSGESVGELMRFYKIPPEKLIVIYDDYDLPQGALRIRAKGSAGTHNGMRSIVGAIGTEFARIRIGIKPAETQVPLMEFVLSKRGREAEERISPALDGAAKAVLGFFGGMTVDDLSREFGVNV